TVGASEPRAAASGDDEGDASRTGSQTSLTRSRAMEPSDDEESRSVFQTASFEPSSLQPETFQAGRGRALLSSEHFRLNYPSRVARGDAESFLRALESARADVVRRVERASLAPVLPDMEVFVY